MTRKKLVNAFSIIYILNGLWDLGIFVYLAWGWSGSTDLNTTQLINGALALYAGFHLSKLHEFGRKFAIFLASVRVTINAILIFWSLFHIKNFSQSGLYFLDERIYIVDSPYAALAFLLTSTIIALLTIVFLSQGETKKIFASEKRNDPDVIVESA